LLRGGRERGRTGLDRRTGGVAASLTDGLAKRLARYWGLREGVEITGRIVVEGETSVYVADVGHLALI
jgi:hypothetical protein